MIELPPDSLWDYGHQVLAVVRNVRACLADLGKDYGYDDEQRAGIQLVLNEKLVALHELLSSEEIVPRKFSLEKPVNPPPSADDIPF